jgi:glycerol-3-phosphate dehydrogenase (NAD(P)+)
MRIGVIGAGSWGTTVANLLAENGHELMLWAREPEVVQSINTSRENTVFLPGHSLHRSLGACGTIGPVVQNAELVVIATPSHAVRPTARQLAECLDGRMVPLVSISKGLEPDTHKLVTEVLEEVIPGATTVAVSGPSFAQEVCRHMPTAVVASSADPRAADTVQQAASNRYFRVYTGGDVVGVQLGGALKNVIAIATGLLDGMGLGHNTRAALITRGLAEMTRLGERMGALAHTFAGLAGMGDLILTSTGDLSRNRTLGIDLGRGRSLQEILGERKTVAEGVNTAKAAVELANQLDVELPIAREVENILFHDKAPRDAIDALMGRELKAETWR